MTLHSQHSLLIQIDIMQFVCCTKIYGVEQLKQNKPQTTELLLNCFMLVGLYHGGLYND